MSADLWSAPIAEMRPRCSFSVPWNPGHQPIREHRCVMPAEHEGDHYCPCSREPLGRKPGDSRP